MLDEIDPPPHNSGNAQKKRLLFYWRLHTQQTTKYRAESRNKMKSIEDKKDNERDKNEDEWQCQHPKTKVAVDRSFWEQQGWFRVPRINPMSDSWFHQNKFDVSQIWYWLMVVVCIWAALWTTSEFRKWNSGFKIFQGQAPLSRFNVLIKSINSSGVMYLWKDLAKCSSDALTFNRQNLRHNKILAQFPQCNYNVKL